MKHFLLFFGVRMAKTADFQALFSIQGGFCDIFVKSARISNNYLKNNKTYVKIIKRKAAY